MSEAEYYEAWYRGRLYKLTINNWTKMLGRSEHFIRGRLKKKATMQEIINVAEVLNEKDGAGDKVSAIQRFLYG